MSILFEPGKIKNLSIKNRFVRSATYDGSADRNGDVSERQLALYSDLARGDVGLIVTAITYVHPSGQVSPVMNSIAEDERIVGFSKLVKTAHEYGAKICVQLFHGGREARWVKTHGELPLAPSVVENDPFYKGAHRAMSEDEIWEVIGAFGEAARRAKEAGADGVQVHGAHAYLLSQFLSPYTNRRNDQWGGSPGNRLRLYKEVYKSIREKVGDEYPVMIKVGVEDGFTGGLDASEGLQAAVELAKVGFDALEISSSLRGEMYRGTEYRTGIHKLENEAYFRAWFRYVKSKVDVPVMAVGGFRTFSLLESVVQHGEADFISLSRPLIREPHLIGMWKSNQNQKAKCISCNKCLESLFEGNPLHCVLEKSAALKGARSHGVSA